MALYLCLLLCACFYHIHCSNGMNSTHHGLYAGGWNFLTTYYSILLRLMIQFGWQMVLHFWRCKTCYRDHHQQNI